MIVNIPTGWLVVFFFFKAFDSDCLLDSEEVGWDGWGWGECFEGGLFLGWVEDGLVVMC